MEVVTIRNGSDVVDLDLPMEVKCKMLKFLEQYSQFAFVKETGDVIAAVDFDGNLDVSMVGVELLNKKK